MSEYLERYKRKIQRAERAIYANQLAALDAKRQAEKLETARKLVSHGVPVDIIADSTGLDANTVSTLKI